MRQYIRYPTDIPVEFSVINAEGVGQYCMRNVSEGGLCFRTDQAIQTGKEVHVAIPVCIPTFEVDGEVAWCQQQPDGLYDVGVRFFEPATEFAARMVEQVRGIENYKQRMQREQGRLLTPEQSAAEWLSAQV